MRCAHCREEIEGQAIAYKGKSYCCQACVFEASVRIGSMCGSRSTVEAGMRYERQRSPQRRGLPAGQHALTIAIDGPVAVGKSSAGNLLATRLGYAFVDTGAMYRALTWKALKLGTDPEDAAALGRLARSVDIRMLPDAAGRTGYRVLVDGEDATEGVRSAEVEASVSNVSRHQQVRRVMVEKQRNMSGKGGLVMVGRDIGTVVLPGADLKVFLEASAGTRAERRHKELADAGKNADYPSVLSDLRARDHIDSTRSDSPLRPAEDSVTIDTEGITLKEVVDRVYSLATGGQCD